MCYLQETGHDRLDKHQAYYRLMLRKGEQKKRLFQGSQPFPNCAFLNWIHECSQVKAHGLGGVLFDLSPTCLPLAKTITCSTVQDFLGVFTVLCLGQLGWPNSPWDVICDVVLDQARVWRLWKQERYLFTLTWSSLYQGLSGQVHTAEKHPDWVNIKEDPKQMPSTEMITHQSSDGVDSLVPQNLRTQSHQSLVHLDASWSLETFEVLVPVEFG